MANMIRPQDHTRVTFDPTGHPSCHFPALCDELAAADAGRPQPMIKY